MNVCVCVCEPVWGGSPAEPAIIIYKWHWTGKTKRKMKTTQKKNAMRCITSFFSSFFFLKFFQRLNSWCGSSWARRARMRINFSIDWNEGCLGCVMPPTSPLPLPQSVAMALNSAARLFEWEPPSHTRSPIHIHLSRKFNHQSNYMFHCLVPALQ